MDNLVEGFRSSLVEVVRGHNDENYDGASQLRSHIRSTSCDDNKQGCRPRVKHEYSEYHGHRQDEDQHEQVSDNSVNYVDDTEGWQTAGRRHRKPPKVYHKVPSEQQQSYKKPPGEQEYADEVGYDVDLEPTEQEFSDLSKACNKLWKLDFNRLVPGQDYEIDCGDGKKPYQKDDMAENALFHWVSHDVFRKPTYARFCALLDNYNPNQMAQEVVTSEEIHEQTAFIEEISRTAPIKYIHKYLVAKGLTSDHYEVFKRHMKSLWFDLFDRSGTFDSSSAFEHVFLGEVKQHQGKEVSGFHNWIQFYLEEAKGKVDYQGYIFPRRRGQVPDSETQFLTIQFTWNGILKSLSSTLIGVSPEFEIALYTLCFYVGREDNHIELGPYSVNVKCYRLKGDQIGSVFPIAED